MAGKTSLKDKLEDDELDLSMMQLTDIPVKEIEVLGPKVVTINLSHNLLTCMPANFPLLAHITKLDLSKNGLVDLPENFGGFKALKSLDLYANRLEKLPVSFAQLKSLKWLDLKDNPLCPALKQAAGDCITPNDCMLCAKKVVALLQSMESQLQRERQRRMEDEGRQQREVDRREEAERERVRQDKRMAKEKRREEARGREAEGRRETEVKSKHETQLNGNGTAAAHQNGSGAPRAPPMARAEGRGLLASIVLFLLGLGVVGLGLAVSMVWVYTEGRLDAESVASALPAIRADLEDYLAMVGQGTVRAWAGVEEAAGPYVESCVRSGRTAWAEGGKHLRKWARWAEREHGPTLARAGSMVRGAADSVGEALRPVWEASRPFFHQLGKAIIEKTYSAAAFLQATFPVYIDWAAETGAAVVEVAMNSWQKMVEAF